MQRPSKTGGKHELRERIRVLADRYETALHAGRCRIGVLAATPVMITAVGVDAVIASHGDPDLLGDSEFAGAAERAGVGGFAIDGADAERARGALTALRGAAGEQHVQHLFDTGQLAMPSGTSSARLTAFTEPGSDIVFWDASGDVVDAANVKIAASARVIVEHFSRHPQVRIAYASSDAAHDAARGHLAAAVVGVGDPIPHSGHVVVDIGKSSVEFDTEIRSAVTALETGWDDYFDWLDQIPWISGGAVAYRALRRIQAGESRARTLRATGKDAVKVTVGKSVGAAAATVTNSEPTIFLLATASTVVANAIFEVRESWDAASAPLRHVANQAEDLLERYDPNHARPGSTWRRRIGA